MKSSLDCKDTGSTQISLNSRIIGPLTYEDFLHAVLTEMQLNKFWGKDRIHFGNDRLLISPERLVDPYDTDKSQGFYPRGLNACYQQWSREIASRNNLQSILILSCIKCPHHREEKRANLGLSPSTDAIRGRGGGRGLGGGSRPCGIRDIYIYS